MHPERLTLQDAIEIMYSSSASIKIYKKDVEMSKARYRQARGDFDVVLNAFVTEERDWLDKKESGLNNDRINSGIEISKKTRWGIELNGGITSTYFEGGDQRADNLIGYFDFSVPLLKSWKATINKAEVISSNIDYQAAKLQMDDSISWDIMNLLIAYWNFVTAYKRMQIAVNTQKRAEILVNEIKELIKNDERPAADINLSLANLSKTSALQLHEEQNFLEKQNNLFTIMGIVGEMEEDHTTPVDKLPEVIKKEWDTEAMKKTVLGKTIKLRRSLHIYEKRQNAAKLRMLAARNGMRHDLDLNLGLSISKYPEGFESSREYGTSYSGMITLSYKLPIGNNGSKGNYSNLAANHQKIQLEKTLLEQEIKSKVTNNLSSLSRIVKKYNEREKSIKLYEKTLENEKQKFKAGISTTIDIITIEDLYTQALLDSITVRLEYAVTLTKLLYETGYIDVASNKLPKIDINKLFISPLGIS